MTYFAIYLAVNVLAIALVGWYIVHMLLVECKFYYVVRLTRKDPHQTNLFWYPQSCMGGVVESRWSTTRAIRFFDHSDALAVSQAVESDYPGQVSVVKRLHVTPAVPR